MIRDVLENISAYLSPIFISSASILARIFYEGNKPSFAHLLRVLFIGIFVGGLAGEIVAHTELSPGYRGVVIAVSAMISDDIISVIIAAGGKLRKDPMGVVREVIPWMRQRK